MSLLVSIYKFHQKIKRTCIAFESKLYTKSIAGEFKSFGSNSVLLSNTKFTNKKYISIGSNFRVEENVKIDAWDEYENKKMFPEIRIGDNVSMNYSCYISAIDCVTIGNGTMMGRNVFITDHSHGKTNIYREIPAKRPLFSKGPVEIKNNVLIGSNVCILSGTSIGENCIIGANSVVRGSFPSNVCLAGAPAKIIRELVQD